MAYFYYTHYISGLYGIRCQWALLLNKVRTYQRINLSSIHVRTSPRRASCHGSLYFCSVAVLHSLVPPHQLCTSCPKVSTASFLHLFSPCYRRVTVRPLRLVAQFLSSFSRSAEYACCASFLCVWDSHCRFYPRTQSSHFEPLNHARVTSQPQLASNSMYTFIMTIEQQLS